MDINDLPKTRGVLHFKSPEYRRKLISVDMKEEDEGTMVTRHHELPPENDLLIDWLEQNSVHYFYSHVRDIGHHWLVQEPNGVLCNVCLSEQVSSGGELSSFKDYVYRRAVTIGFQPVEKGLPSVLIGTLNQLGFEEVTG